LIYRLIYRRFEENDLDSLLRLLRSAFSGFPTLQYWDWKYAKNPNGSPITWVAEDGGKIVGCYILNPVKLRIGQNLVMGAQSVDAAVDNAYRGGGIFKKLAGSAITQATKDGVSIIYAFPTDIAYKGQVRIGYRPVSIIPKMFRIFRIGSMFEGRVSLSGSSIQKALGMIDNFQRINNNKIKIEFKHQLNVTAIRNFDSRFEAFWKEICKGNHNLLVERDVPYLNWRYMKHPERNYTTFVCEKNGEIMGYIVVNVEKKIHNKRGDLINLSTGNIIDLLTLPNMTNAAYPLISAACSLFEHESVDIAGCWMSRHQPHRQILQKCGFSNWYELLRRTVSRSKYGSYIICYVNSKATIQAAIKSRQNPSKPCRWFITQGDADFT
jgi:predicted N-acetyltransferase YhbS